LTAKRQFDQLTEIEKRGKSDEYYTSEANFVYQATNLHFRYEVAGFVLACIAAVIDVIIT
jgi:hypothetical protein